MISGVKALGLETCVTLGMLDTGQAQRFKQAGLDYYNHNIDTSPEFYGEIITTRTFQDRLDTLETVRAAGIKVCCGGIVGMGESRRDWAAMLTTTKDGAVRAFGIDDQAGVDASFTISTQTGWSRPGHHHTYFERTK